MTVYIFKCGKSIKNYKIKKGYLVCCPICGARLDFKIIWCEDCGKQLLINSKTNNRLYCRSCLGMQSKIGKYDYYNMKKASSSIYIKKDRAPAVDYLCEDNNFICDDEIKEKYYSSHYEELSSTSHYRKDIDYFNTIDAFRKLMGIDKVIEEKKRYLKYDDID